MYALGSNARSFFTLYFSTFTQTKRVPKRFSVERAEACTLTQCDNSRTARRPLSPLLCTLQFGIACNPSRLTASY